MPELPEVETVLRGLAPVMIDQTIETTKINRYDLRVPIPQNFAAIFEAQRIKTLLRRGKYILVFTEAGDGFVLHLGMSGRIRIYKDGEHCDVQKHDHVIFTMASGTQIVFHDPRRFGMLYHVHQKNWPNEKPFIAMGPEPLGNHFHMRALKEALQNKASPIKTALLDQAVVAGLGNIYVCEALYQSGISPFRAANDIAEHELEKLVQAIRNVLNRAIESGGSSLRDYQQTDGQLGYFQYGFTVYDREGMACPDCSCIIEQTKGVRRAVQSGRSTFYCETKQI